MGSKTAALSESVDRLVSALVVSQREAESLRRELIDACRDRSVLAAKLDEANTARAAAERVAQVAREVRVAAEADVLNLCDEADRERAAHREEVLGWKHRAEELERQLGRIGG